MILRTALLGLFTAITLIGQGFAPDSLANHVFTSEATAATGIAVPPPRSGVLTSTGIAFTFNTRGEPLTKPATYTWTKTGPNEGVYTETEGGLTSTAEITFTSAGAGTFRQTLPGAISISGNVYISIIPQAAALGAPPLVNISTRAIIASGGVLNPGFVVGGSVSRRVLVRAVGPGLSQFGVTGTVANPTLAVWSGQVEVGANDDHAAETAAVAAMVGAFALPVGSRDAAVLLTLRPGNYTVTIRGSSSTDAGEILAEVYFVD